MSQGKNNDNLQDYLDLLEEYKNKDVPLDEPKDNETTNLDNTVNNEDISFGSTDFFSDYEDDELLDEPFEKNNGEKSFNKVSDLDETRVLEDISSNSEKTETKFQKIIGKLKNNKVIDWYKALPKKKQITIKVTSIVLAVLIVLAIIIGSFVNYKLNLLGDKVNPENPESELEAEENFEDIVIDIGSEGFKQALQDWATTGNDRHMSSKNVINVLLIGADSRKGTNTGNTDVMMLLSLNRRTKELKLISFLRDSYLYIEGANRSYCTKLNAAFSMGGPETLLKTIENNYKIDIDNYVMVNFQSFAAIIDAMGGVTVDVQQYEADYNYRKFKVQLPVGENVTLNGKQALCFCRIRGCDADGDVSRTRRQRQVIDSIVDRVNSASVGELNKYIDILLPYVDTGYSKGQILSLGVKALTGGWARYERTELQMPPEDCRTSGSANMWIWVVDYQKAANMLQNGIYGSSNIVLDENRTTIIDVYRGASYSGGGNNISSNNTKDEPEKPKTTAKKEEVKTTVENKPIYNRPTENIVDTENKKPVITTNAEATTAPVSTTKTTAPVSTTKTTIPVSTTKTTIPVSTTVTIAPVTQETTEITTEVVEITEVKTTAEATTAPNVTKAPVTTAPVTENTVTTESVIEDVA